MSPVVGLVSFPDKDAGKSPFSKALKHIIDLEARKLIGNAYFRTEKIIRDNKDKLKAVRITSKIALNNIFIKSHLFPRGVNR